MSEYWVSQAKYYCKVCQVYIADNKPSRQHHDNGAKHKEKLELHLKKKREDKLHGARSEIELKRQLAEINEAAKQAIEVDRTEHAGSFYQAQGYRPPPPPPAPQQFQSNKKPLADDDDDDEEGLETGDDTGIYTVRGQTYLQGKMHEEKIRTGVRCEIFLEELDEWCPGAVDARHEMPIPHTELMLVTFDVHYSMPPPSQEGHEGPPVAEAEEPTSASAIDTSAAAAAAAAVVEKDVKSDRLRLLATVEGGVILTTEAEAQAMAETQVPPVVEIDENTGVGMWQTVTVREVDADQARQEAEESARQRDWMLSSKDDDPREQNHPHHRPHSNNHKRGLLDDAMEQGYEDGSALSAYDPYGRHKNVYRGIKLHEDAMKKEQIESISDGAIVGFKKKRKVVSTSSAPATTIKLEHPPGKDLTEIPVKQEHAIGPNSSSSSNISSSDNKNSSSVGNSSQILAAAAAAPARAVKAEPPQRETSGIEGVGQTGTSIEATIPAAPAPAAVVMKMKIGGGGGGAKRQFRKRNPSP